MAKWKLDGTDLVGLTAIVGCFVLIALGKNSYVMAVLLTITGYYFGSKSKARRR